MNRSLEPGQEVPLLRRTTKKKLFARREGPFFVTRKVSAVNYEILTDKGPKTYHINLLRPWRDRESDARIPQINLILTAEPCQTHYEALEGIDDDKEETYRYDKGSTEEQKGQPQEILTNFKDKFAEKLSYTNGLKHSIKLQLLGPPQTSARGISILDKSRKSQLQEGRLLCV